MITCTVNSLVVDMVTAEGAIRACVREGGTIHDINLPPSASGPEVHYDARPARARRHGGPRRWRQACLRWPCQE